AMGWCSEDLDVATLDSKPPQQAMHGKLRMVRRGMLLDLALRGRTSADGLPGRVVEIGVEARQYDSAVPQGCHRVEEFCRRRHRAVRSRRDDRTVMMRGQARRFG